VVDITVNCGVQKETRFLTPSGITKKPGFPKKRNRVSVVDIIVNCGVTKRNPVSETKRDNQETGFPPEKKPGFCGGYYG
jgi:hypothetical protein